MFVPSHSSCVLYNKSGYFLSNHDENRWLLCISDGRPTGFMGIVGMLIMIRIMIDHYHSITTKDD